MTAKRVLILLAALLFLLTACAASSASPPATLPAATATSPAPFVAAAPTSAPAAATLPPPTLEPSPTATLPPSPTPLALQAHEWLAGPVLLRYDIDCTDFCGGETFSHYPRLILYSDGRLITVDYQGRTLLKEARLTREQMCAVLNSFDATGLFDYDLSAFYEADDAFPRLSSGAHASITVWNEAAIPLGRMADFRPGSYLGGQVVLNPPLLLGYHLIERLAEVRGEAPYVPSELAVRVFTVAPDDDPAACCFAMEAGEWPVTAVRLADLVAQGTPRENDPRQVFTTVSGPAVEQLLAAFGDDPLSETSPLAFQEDGQRYVVAIRALLPYESLASLGYPTHSSIIPGPDVAATQTPLSCTPDDGVVDFYADVVAAAAQDTERLAGFPRPTAAPITPPPPSSRDEFQP